MPMLIMSSQWGGNWLPIGQLLLLVEAKVGGFGGSMGSVGVGLGQGVVLISLLNSLSNKVPPYTPSGID